MGWWCCEGSCHIFVWCDRDPFLNMLYHNEIRVESPNTKLYLIRTLCDHVYVYYSHPCTEKSVKFQRIVPPVSGKGGVCVCVCVCVEVNH